MSNVLISIASEFDKKGFRQAQTSTDQLSKAVNKLGKQVLAVFSTAKVMQYSKASVLAYTEDRRQASLLANQLKNLGLSYSALRVDDFIAKLEAQTGILDDELRPAFSELARVTGSVAKSQQLMALAFDASRGAGVSFEQAVSAISQAYVGNLKGLKALNTGLSQAQLKTMSFEEIVTTLNNKFKGAGAASVEDYAGKLDRLKVSAANAQETIGKGFVDAFSILADDQDFNNVINSIDNAATGVADIVRGVSVILDKINRSTPKWLIDFLNPANKGIIGLFREIGKKNRLADPMSSAGGSYFSKIAADKQAAAAAKTAAKAAAARLAAEKKITSEKKAQAALDKANALIAKAQEKFDLEGIQLNAALMNQSLTIEERKRLELKQAIWDLEQALAQNDQERIASATAMLQKLLDQFNVLTKQLATLEEMYKVFAALGVDKNLINLLNLEDALNLMNQMAILGQITLPKDFPKPTSTMVTKEEAAAALAAATTPEAMAWQDAEVLAAANRRSFVGGGALPTGTLPPVVNVTIDGSVSDLIDVVVDGLQNKSASGVDTRILRNTGGFNW